MSYGAFKCLDLFFPQSEFTSLQALCKFFYEHGANRVQQKFLIESAGPIYLSPAGRADNDFIFQFLKYPCSDPPKKTFHDEYQD